MGKKKKFSQFLSFLFETLQFLKQGKRTKKFWESQSNQGIKKNYSTTVLPSTHVHTPISLPRRLFPFFFKCKRRINYTATLK